jgi:hypothetical protein
LLQVFQRLLQQNDQGSAVTLKVVQQIGEAVAKEAPFLDDPVLQRMKFSLNWCGKILRQFVSSGMPDSVVRPKAPVLHSNSPTETFCPSNSSLFLKISSSVENIS